MIIFVFCKNSPGCSERTNLKWNKNSGKPERQEGKAQRVKTKIPSSFLTAAVSFIETEVLKEQNISGN